jgi:muramidase (phage lysozyme)
LSFIKDYGKDYSTHPRVLVKSANSTAAGAYQILGWVYDQLNGFEIDPDTYKKTGIYNEKSDYIKKHKLPDFSALSQDRLCLILLKYYRKGSIEALINNNINKALDITSFEWASLPHNDKNYEKTKTQWRYPGQHGQTLEEARSNYKMFLKEELEGKTKYLQIKKGFLKEFGYDCCGKETQSTDNGKWRMPIDNPMLCLYSQGGAEKPWHGSFGENIRDGSVNHTGNDLLAEPGTNVYACVKSKVHKVYTSTSLAGNALVLKVIDVETFKTLRNNDYVAKYKNKGELLEKSFDHDGDIYLTFWHLSKNDFFKEGDEVKHNDVVGLTGVSGNNGVHFTTRNPHLHFEVSNVGSVAGLKDKCNPSVYFKFKTEDEMSQEEKDYQFKTKEKEWK